MVSGVGVRTHGGNRPGRPRTARSGPTDTACVSRLGSGATSVRTGHYPGSVPTAAVDQENP